MRHRRRLVLVRGAALTFALAGPALGCAQHDANGASTDEGDALGESDATATIAAPIELTASDGTGLRLVRLDVRGAVQAPLAFTELHLTFENPENRILEGRFSIDLPSDSALSRFAMKIDDQWQEGEVVERVKARATYEAYLHNNVDPALLEKQAGNRFSAKVFPIPANGRKEIIISYSQELGANQAAYRLPLRGLPKLDAFNAVFFVDEPDAETDQAKRRVVELHQTDHVPTSDLEVDVRGTAPTFGVRKGDAVVARVQARGNTAAVPLERVTLAFDTSASRAVGYADKVRRFADLVKSIAKEQSNTAIVVLAFDQEVATIFEGAAGDFGQVEVDALFGRRALGASNLVSVLEEIDHDPSPPPRIVLVTDGIATAGPREVSDLRAALEKLASKGVERLDAIVDAERGSHEVLDAIVSSPLPIGGTVSTGDVDDDILVRRLTHEVLPPLEVKVPGATEWWPKRAEALQPGDSILVYASLPPQVAMRVILEGEEVADISVPLIEVPGPLIERALASAKIDALTIAASSETVPAIADRLRQQVIALSIESRVISDFTAMLVLESAQDYARFSIDRKSEVDILTVGPEGVTLTPHVRDLQEPAPKPRSSGLFAMRGPDRDDDAPEDNENEAGGFGTRHKGEEGQMGRAVSQSGLLGAMAQSSGHFLASPYGGAFAVGNDDEDVWGGLTGTEVGEEFGVGGLGLVGTGAGGGGVGEGTIGLGNDRGTGAGFGRAADAGEFSRRMRVPRVQQSKLTVKGPLDKDIIRRITRAHVNEIRHCYNRGLEQHPALQGNIALTVRISGSGTVDESTMARNTLGDVAVGRCAAAAVGRWRFPRSKTGGTVLVRMTYELGPAKAHRPMRTARVGAPPPAPEFVRPTSPVSTEPPEDLTRVDSHVASSYTGNMKEVMELLDAGSLDTASARAHKWRDSAPGDIMALVALGEVYEARGDDLRAQRAYGSLIDLFPSDAPIRRYVGARLQRLGDQAHPLAIDTFREAVALRPDHPSSHRGLAYALLATQAFEPAFEAIAAGLHQSYPDRYRGVDSILQDDASIIAAAWLAAHPDQADTIRIRARALRVGIAAQPSTHMVLSWETDANDVDLHVYDAKGYHSYYANRGMNSGGGLYADVTDGYGPESFTISGTPSAYPYRIDVKYFRQGPSGHGLGALQLVQHDGRGNVELRTVPYALMNDGGMTRLFELDGPLANSK